MKNVIITGANGNLGTAVTSEFLNKGYRVIATVETEAARLSLAEQKNLVVEIVNLSNEDDATKFILDCITKYNSIDAALLLVGGFTAGNISVTSGNDLRQQFSLNFETAYYCTRPLFAHMINRNEGKIAFIGARPAIMASQGYGLLAYSLSKSLLFKLAEYLNEEAKGKNVSVSVIVPSTLDTPLNRKSMPDANPENWVKPSAIAEILEFLVSEKSNVMRETVLKVYNNA
jgi:NAD(P)-dependent dehydrogenase (short-subunit alcohol dehydrogenase family)